MKLFELAKKVDCDIFGSADVDILGLSYDSRNVKPGDLFFCISGFTLDGHNFGKQAAELGAVALVVLRKLPVNLPQLIVKDDREAMALISEEFYSHPSREMTMVGITGTNGKTTTTYMIRSIAKEAGYKVGVIGTICNMIGDKRIEAERTTPEAPDLQKMLREMADNGCTMAVMEVSSHSLDLARVHGMVFDAGIFTNLTQDHLDYHETMEKYMLAKKRLFFTSKMCISNADDPAGMFMIDKAQNKVTYGIKNSSTYMAKDIKLNTSSVAYKLAFPMGEEDILVNIPGEFSVYNSLAAISCTLELGLNIKHVKNGLIKLKSVEGRFEVLDSGGRDFTIILDYAHTPDSLDNILRTAKGCARGRIVTIFGCGGDRDRKKRPIMGEIAGNKSDFTIITSDNPRTEEPADIIAQIEQGIKKTSGEYICIENRREAIRYALTNARKNDFILLAGKGHETYQEINHVKHHFDEKEVVKELLKEI